MTSTAVAATWVGIPSRSRDLGKLEPGDEVKVPVDALSSRNFAADADALGKATVPELVALAAALGVASDPKASKADVVAAIEPIMKDRRTKLPKRSPSKPVDLSAAVETTPEGVTVNAD